MKKLIATILISIPLCASSQIQLFDSSFTFISSQTEDILNPVFYKGTYAFAYFSSNDEQFILYEKGINNSRNIVARRFIFSGLAEETMLTGDSLFNTNAVLANSKGSQVIQYALAVFETHSQGIARLRYSFYENSSWTNAMFVSTDSSQCTSPSLTNLGRLNSNIFLLAYIKEGAVYVRRFDAGTWGREMKISPDIANRNYYSPEILSFDYVNYSGLAHAALNYDSAGVRKIMYCLITSHSPDSSTAGSFLYFPSEGNKTICGFSRASYEDPVLNFNYDVGGSLKFYSAHAQFPNSLSIFPQENLPGDNFSGSGTAVAIITEDLLVYAAGSWINTHEDTSWACCKHFVSSVKKYRIAESVQEKAISVSPLIRNPMNYECGIWITWNDIENGRYVIKASLGTLYLAGINSNELEIQNEFTLHQNYPNPFNPSTKISFGILKAAKIDLKLYDILGNEVKTLFSGYLKEGEYSVRVEQGDLNSGVYFYKLTSGKNSATRKMLLIK